MSVDKKRTQEHDGTTPAEEKRDTETRSSRIPAAIRAYSGTGDLPRVSDLSIVSSDRPTQRTATTGLSALTRPVQMASEGTVNETVLQYLKQMEDAQTPTRFSAENISFIAASGRISPEVSGARTMETSDDRNEQRARSIQRIWDLLGEFALRDVTLSVTSCEPAEASEVVHDDWLYPVEFCFNRAATNAAEQQPLVRELREQLEGSRAIMVLFRRDRDEHPLLRTQNLHDGQRLTLTELDTFVRYGEGKSRQLAVLAGSATPGANRWFGLQDDYAAMVVSFRDLTLVGLFGLDRLGRFVSFAESLETLIRASE